MAAILLSTIISAAKSTKDEPLVIASGEYEDLNSGLIWLDATAFFDVPLLSYTPTASRTLWPGTLTIVDTEPFVISSGILIDLSGNSGTILWTNAARIPQTVSTLLIIGV